MNDARKAKATVKPWMYPLVAALFLLALGVGPCLRKLRMVQDESAMQGAENSRIALTTALVRSGLNGALDLCRAHLGQYPQTDQGGLQLLLRPPNDPEFAKRWSGPYVRRAKDLRDAWNHELIYQCPGEMNENGYDLMSCGPDGVAGTSDDIANWEPRGAH